VADFLEGIIALGAKPFIVAAIKPFYPELDTKRFETLDCSDEEQFVNARAIRKLLHKRLFTVETIVKLFTVFLQNVPQHYSIAELKGLLMLMFNLIVEKLYQLALNDFMILIGTILDAYSSTQYEEEVRLFFIYY